MTTLPPKVRLPKRGRLSWSKRYFDVGETARLLDGRSVKITRVYRNRYGRVSYWAGDELILTEDLAHRS